MPAIRLALLLFALLAAVTGGEPARAQVRVENTATLRWTAPDGSRRVQSNTVALTYARNRMPTRISFRMLPPDYQLSGMRCDMPDRRFTPAPIDAATLAAAPPLKVLDGSEPMIAVLEAPSENVNPMVRDVTALQVNAGAAVIQLPVTETGVNTGVFAAGLPGVGDLSDPALAPCALKLKHGDRVSFSFAGDDDSLASDSSLLVDPVGYVFDSVTGELVDGATVEMIDLEGRPATVFGDDGVSRYPSTMISGTAVTDAGGNFYPAVRGRYRFPLAPPGQYRLRVTPPPTYSAPSTATPEALARLTAPGGGDFVINDASFAGVLTLATPEPFIADIPLDPAAAAGSLLLTKVASVRTASPGDAIQYRLRVTNRGDAPARGLHITDTLPTGLRYRTGSARGGDEPAVTSDGRRLLFPVPDLPKGGAAELTYLVTVAPGAPVGEAVNRAAVTGGATSNEAAASVRLRPLLFTDALTVIGRVTEGNCGDPSARRRGVAGIRLMLEDGTFVVTDKDGLYHLEGLRPGTHVVQIDRASIPATHEAVACDRDTRQAQNPLSRFVEGQGGLTKRVDFQLRPTGRVAAAPAGRGGCGGRGGAGGDRRRRDRGGQSRMAARCHARDRLAVPGRRPQSARALAARRDQARARPARRADAERHVGRADHL
jgi:uncharacterized repeat protein (TIGR01451 family)